MDDWHDFPGPNAGYVLELYDRFRQNPESVDAATRAYLATWSPPAETAALAAPEHALEKIVGAVNLAQAIRAYGHLAARLDPLGSSPRGDPILLPSTHGVTDDDLRQLPASLICGPVMECAANALEATQALRAVYSSSTGYGYSHILVPEERDWLRYAAESGRFRSPQNPTSPVGIAVPDYADGVAPQALLERLTQIEAFEHFLQRTFPGKTRFSLEGLDMLVPILDEIIGQAAESNVRTILIGMAHRGRLNILAHVLGKPYTQILAEFKDPARATLFTLREDLGWTGDVRYHMGARRALRQAVVVSMPPNPSHLEAVNPVVEGMARAAGIRTDQPGPPQFDPTVSLPILIHGDAAFPGQGVVAETLNLSRLPGYHTGGTLHIIANNQLGYTTLPEETRSTLYASDLAKGFEIPIVHVNADDPEACIEVARLALAYRHQFHKDFLIDLIGYRRYGHNEGDEPSFTQPLMYHAIERHPTVRERWANTLLERGLIEKDWPNKLVDQYIGELERVLESLRPEVDRVEPQAAPPPAGAARQVKTAVPVEQLRKLHDALLQLPDGFSLNPKLERAMRRRRQALDALRLDELTIDWALAEQLALASILEDGIAIRLTGEDVERGTFGQRHAVFHDVSTGQTFTPLQALPQAKAAFDIYNSPLTENAAIGFEYGYNVQEPKRLVIWEAQYGDFINSAQVMIDEFVTSARAKWGQTPSLVLLLPHGSEGQGPDHSGARLERFLELAAETNLRIANPTTAAQYFHLLRRQAALLETDPLPLVVMTPKSLLRHPRAASSLRDLTEGHWQPVTDDAQARQQPDQVRRLILCNGKVYFDLTREPRDKSMAIAIARVEQLYLFPVEELQGVLNGYPHLNEVIWLQEEPENMGAWTTIRRPLEDLIGGRWPLRYIGRPANASPAEGSSTWYAANQKIVVERAHDLRDV